MYVRKAPTIPALGWRRTCDQTVMLSEASCGHGSCAHSTNVLYHTGNSCGSPRGVACSGERWRSRFDSKMHAKAYARIRSWSSPVSTIDGGGASEYEFDAATATTRSCEKCGMMWLVANATKNSSKAAMADSKPAFSCGPDSCPAWSRCNSASDANLPYTLMAKCNADCNSPKSPLFASTYIARSESLTRLFTPVLSLSLSLSE